MDLTTSQIKVLIVDDEEIVRYGLKAILTSEPTVAVVGEAGDGENAIAQAKNLHPDVVLMDINMPVMDGVTATKEICKALPQTKIIILTTHDGDEYLFEALQKGATGYLLKNAPPEDLICVVQSTHRGYLQISPRLSQRVCQQLAAAFEQGVSDPYQTEKPMRVSALSELSDGKDITPREQEVLSLIAEGASNREIAQILHIAEKTVKNHVSSLLKRVGVRDRTQLAIWANGLKKDALIS